MQAQEKSPIKSSNISEKQKSVKCDGLQSVITDFEGNEYRTVKIGNGEWMSENLKTTRFNDGTAIPLLTGNSAWSSQTGPACCYYKNMVIYSQTYGALYKNQSPQLQFRKRGWFLCQMHKRLNCS